LICIEEPELGLHPDAMSLLADLLVEASEKTQLVVTTHSDLLVSALTEQTETVLVCDYLENGTNCDDGEGEIDALVGEIPVGRGLALGKSEQTVVKAIAIYIEGGGDTAQTLDPLRRGMSVFLKSVVDEVRRVASVGV
jgi:predicted ATP-binding protein involved in virulence